MESFKQSAAYGIMLETHGSDVDDMDVEEQINALNFAAETGREQFIDTLICMLPQQLRVAASRLADAGAAGI